MIHIQCGNILLKRCIRTRFTVNGSQNTSCFYNHTGISGNFYVQISFAIFNRHLCFRAVGRSNTTDINGSILRSHLAIYTHLI